MLWNLLFLIFIYNSYYVFLLMCISMVYLFPSSYFLLICDFIFEIDFLWWHTLKSCFLIHYGNLCLLFGVSWPFALNVCIDIASFKSAILLLVLYLSHLFFFVCLFNWAIFFIISLYLFCWLISITVILMVALGFLVNIIYCRSPSSDIMPLHLH